MDMLRTTAPYYRSYYVFAARADRGLRPDSLDDPLLHELTIGVQLVGDDGANPPPAEALARRGLVPNLRGYMVYGDYSQPNPPARILDAVASGTVDIAAVWGPLAGWYARHAPVPLVLTPLRPAEPGIPLAFDIAMGVRRGDTIRRNQVERVLRDHRAEVDSILDEYGVPRVGAAANGGQP